MYPDADVVVICYSIDSPDSLMNVLEKWAPEVKHFCPGVPVILCGNKKDLRNNEEVKQTLSESKQVPVQIEDGMLAANAIEAVSLVECSALTKAGVMQLFETAAQASLKKKAQKKNRKFKPKNCCIL